MEDEKKPTEPGQESKNSKEDKSQSHRGHNKSGNKLKKVQRESKLDNFKGNHEDLEGHVYTYDGYAKASQFRKTTEKIGEWAKLNCSNFPLDVWKSIDALEEPDLANWKPNAPDDMDDPVEATIFKDEVQEFGKRKRAYRDNATKLYSVVVGQCSEATKAKLEALNDWKDIKQDHSLVRLLKAIKSLLHNQIQDQCYEGVTAFDSLKTMINIRQQRHEETAEYRKRFLTTREVLEHITISFGAQFQGIADGLLASEYNTTREAASEEEAIECEYLAGERVLAVMLLKQACKIRYGELVRELQNDFLKGKNNYPLNVTAAYKMLANWKQPSRASDPTPALDGMVYVMAGKDTGETNGGFVAASAAGAVLVTDGKTKTNGKDYSNYICNNCNEKGHVWRKCPKPYSSTANAMMDCHENTGGEDDGDREWATTFSEDGMYNDGAVLIQNDIALTSSGNETTTSYDEERKVLPAGTIGMDSLSTVDLFCDNRMLTNIRKVPQMMKIRCNAGIKTVRHMGHLAGYGDVWFDQNAVANILSLGRVTNRFKVTFDSEGESGFILHLPDGRKRSFRKTNRGLYATQFLKSRKLQECEGVALSIATVEGNKSEFTKREVKQAERARRLQTTLMFPSDRHLTKITEILQDCPVSSQDVANANTIFGPSIGALKGKTTKSKSTPVTVVPVRIPDSLRERLRELHLHADVCFVNGTAFIVSIAEKIKFCTAEAVANRTDDTLVAALKKIQGMYRHSGYRVIVVSLDGEFTSARERIRDEAHMDLNSVTAGEHVPVIERHIRHLKEGVRGMFHMLPFDKNRKLPQRMIIELVYAKTFFKNAVPALDGVSEVLSPREIITQQRINYNRHCALIFGQYVQTHEEHDNSMKSRTIGAIALRPTGARQGGYYFLNLQTGRVITRNHWTECVMPREVIDRVHSLASRNDMIGVEFRDRLKNLTDSDSMSEEGGDSDYSDEDNSSSDGDNDDDRNAQIAGVGETHDITSEPGYEYNADVFPNEPGDEYNADAVLSPAGVNIDVDAAHVDEAQSAQNEEAAPSVSNEEQDLESRYGPRTTAYNLRPRRAPTYDIEALLAMGDVSNIKEAMSIGLARTDRVVRPSYNVGDPSDIFVTPDSTTGGTANCRDVTSNCYLTEVMMTQYGLNKGLKLFGDKGVAAVQKELQQIHDREVLIPVDATQMSQKERLGALRYHMFLKEKSSGVVKGRGCADGRKQRSFIHKDSASSPTISTEALFLIITTAAKEGRDVASVDVPGAYLQTELKDEKVVVKFEGKMAELLETIDPEMYRQYVIVEKGKKVLYAELAKVLYGLLRGALLFWEKISAQLLEWGFTINPYDWCVANKDVEFEVLDENSPQKRTESAQMTVGWHVDDFIITHKSQDAVDNIISKMNNLYGDLQPLTVHRGSKHRYLGMDLDFSQSGKVTISMDDYVEEMLSEAPDDFIGKAATPAAEHLFNTNPDATKLATKDATLFHHLVAKALFLCKRARPDTQLTVTFLCSRVKEPDVDDWKKLKRLFEYIRASQDLSLTLEATEETVTTWWVDASYAVHTDCRSHSGAVFSLGKGAVYSGSHKQKLNSKSSTEAEIIAVDDFIGQVLWTQYFLQAQGWNIPTSVLYQDNESSILLEKNGRKSSSKRTRHINVRYYFVTDRIHKGEVNVKYCPAAHMVADYLTKPLQGAAFRRFRNAILNISEPEAF